NITGKVGGEPQHDGWHSLWTIHAPPKAKHILWRISKGCLPTRMGLQERHVPCPLSCPLCNHDNEDDWHVLFGCDVSIQARQTAGLELIVQPIASVS
ncbi:pentatricopeptide repeat-containing protein, partial [Trifolium medium]|nr:pentatricopeptide repeat-containing protein [Trifolium medium]